MAPSAGAIPPFPALSSPALALLTLAMFANAGIVFGQRILSSLDADLATEFIYWRKFGFGELRTGHIPLWNPHVFSGVPFMGGFQAALFYPFNWIYLVLPLRTAINCEIVLHVFLLGLFTAAWLRRYRLHPLAMLLACTVTMFGAPFFLHIYPGHLAALDAMAWIPLILLTLEELFERPTAKWVMIGIIAFSMQFLAGHPQTLFNTLVMCLIYGSMRMLRSSYRKQTLAALAIVGVGAITITAVQLWTGLNASSEGTRQGGVPFAFAAMFSFPPENFLTLLVPGLFGNMTGLAYWGRCYLWEMSAFIGLTSLVLVGFGATVKFRDRGLCIVMVAVAAVLALGNHTPLFALLYRFAPGFDHFRSQSKFLVQATPFLAILTGQGMNQVLRSPRGTRSAAGLVMATALIIGAVGVGLWFFLDAAPIQDRWEHLMNAVAATGESYFPLRNYADPQFVASAASFAGARCLISAAILVCLAVLFYLRAMSEKAALAIAILGIAELFLFANSSLTTFSMADSIPSTERDFLSARPGDYRILELPNANGAIAIGARDIWGYDPMVLGALFPVRHPDSQGGDPNDADMYVALPG